MGLTISCANINNQFSSVVLDQLTVRVVTPDGSLREFVASISAFVALEDACETHFLNNSDMLYFDSEITAMDPTKLLQPEHLYFMLPVLMLGNVLLGLDMAALAVKASSALTQQSNSKKHASGGTRRVRVVPDPIIELNENKDATQNAKLNQRINEDMVMVGGTRSSVAVTIIVKAVKKPPVRKGPKAMRRQLSIIMEVVE